jgi:hypothetical protein
MMQTRRNYRHDGSNACAVAPFNFLVRLHGANPGQESKSAFGTAVALTYLVESYAGGRRRNASWKVSFVPKKARYIAISHASDFGKNVKHRTCPLTSKIIRRLPHLVGASLVLVH